MDSQAAEPERSHATLPATGPANTAATSVYVAAGGLFLLRLVAELVSPSEERWPFGLANLVFFGGAAAYSLGFAWAAWRMRPLPRVRLPWPTVALVLLHGVTGVGLAAWFNFVKFNPPLADEWLPSVGRPAVIAGVLALALGWLPGTLLRRYAHGAGGLMLVGFAGLAWIGLLMLALE